MRLGMFLTIAFVAVAGSACGSVPPAPAGADISGKWQGTWQYQTATLGKGQMTMTLTQTGSK
jgi:hypothetical protein